LKLVGAYAILALPSTILFRGKTLPISEVTRLFFLYSLLFTRF